jgi:phage/plasmid-associated DNA primase
MSELQPGITEHTLSELDLTTDTSGDTKVVCGFNLTDMGNANRLIALHGDEIRYSAELKTWFVWNGIRWVPDKTKLVEDLAKRTVVLIHAEVSFSPRDTPKVERKLVTAWAYASEAQLRIREMIKSAESDPRVAISASDFDANKKLINCPNGTIDLENRVFKPHDRHDLLTMCTTAPYNPWGASALFFSTVFKALPLPEVVYGQRLLGSFLEYTTQNKQWLYIYGLPFALKSSVTQAVYAALGDYAKAFPLALLEKSRHNVASNAARPEIVELEGVRIAWNEEAPPNFVIDETTLKSLTSSGIESVRQVYERQRQVQLGCSFVIESNGTYTFDIDDEWSREAALDRTCVMKFVNQIPKKERDREILKRLTNDEAELTTALSWVIQGYFDQLDYGIETPASITATSDEFEAVINPLNLFVKRELVFDDGKDEDGKDFAEVSTPLSALFDRFQETADADAIKKFKNERSFNIQFKAIATYYAKRSGVEIRSEHKRNGIVWSNVRLKDPEEYEVEHFAAKEEKAEREVSCDDVTQKSDLVKTPIGITQYYKTLHQNCVLRHEPTFPTILVNDLEPLELDFSTIDERSDEIKNCDVKFTNAVKQAILPTTHYQDPLELTALIRGILLAAKGAGLRIDNKEQLAEAMALQIKQQHPEWRDYDVLGFYKRLEETDKEIQGLIVDLMEG